MDRWKLLSDGNDIVDVSQETSTVPTNKLFALKLDVETEDKKFGIAQVVENNACTGLIGNSVTLSFQAKKVSDTSKLDNIKCAIISWSSTQITNSRYDIELGEMKELILLWHQTLLMKTLQQT